MTEQHSPFGSSRLEPATADRSIAAPTAGAAVGATPTGRRRNDRIISASPQMQAVVDQASAIARSNDPVLIFGPSGSGRRHVARAIHQWSTRAAGPLVEVQIAGLNEPLQLRELFGDSAARGALARAEGGTLLLESADTISPTVLTRLRESEGTANRARILATGLGETTDGMGSNLTGLGGQRIQLAPLAERIEDILPLAAHFLAEFAALESLDSVGFSADARRWLLEEPWSGNVRELRERIRQAIRLAGQGAISAEALMLSTEGDEIPSFKEAKRAFETRYVEGLLRRCEGNISRAARMAKKDRKDFYDVIRRTGVDPGQFRG